MASRATARMSFIHVFRDAFNYGLEILGLSDIELKEKQYEALKAVVLKNRDVLAVLPTRYGKSLIYQLFPLVLDFFTANGSPVRKSTVIVISPLNALMRDQIVKLKEGGRAKVKTMVLQKYIMGHVKVVNIYKVLLYYIIINPNISNCTG